MKELFLLFTLFSINGFAEVSVQSKTELVEFSEGPYQYRTGMFAKDSGWEVYEYPRLELNPRFGFFLVHTPPEKADTRKAVAKLSTAFSSKGWPIYLLPDVASVGDRVGDWDLYPFKGDSHRIIFKGENIVLSGRNFTECACSAAKSFIFLSQTKSALNLFLILDAIVDFGFNVVPDPKERLLSDLTDKMSDAEFLKYLEAHYFDKEKVLCKYDPPTIEVLNRTFQFRIYRHGKDLGLIGNGSELINLHFYNSDEFLQKIN